MFSFFFLNSTRNTLCQCIKCTKLSSFFYNYKSIWTIHSFNYIYTHTMWFLDAIWIYDHSVSIVWTTFTLTTTTNCECFGLLCCFVVIDSIKPVSLEYKWVLFGFISKRLKYLLVRLNTSLCASYLVLCKFMMR